MKKTVNNIVFSILLMIIGIGFTSCSDSEETSSGDIRSALQQSKWVCRTSDEPLVGDDYQWIITDDYEITLYFVSDYECVIKYFRKHYYSDDGTSYENDAQTVRYTTQGSKVVLETSDYTELEFMFNGGSLIGKDNVYTKEAISYSDREWIDENFNHIKSDEELQEENNIKKVISENVVVTGEYSNYVWHFKITSTLHNVIKNQEIEFGIGHGDVNGITTVSVGDQANIKPLCSKYVCRNSGNKFIAEFDIPFWLYYLFGMEYPREDICNECAMYYVAYKNLLDTDPNGWTNDDKELCKDLMKYLDKYEKEAVRYYEPSVWVSVGSKNYMIKEF